MATVAKSGTEQPDRAVAAARAAHEEGQWRRTPPAERAAVLDAIARRLAERLDEMAALQVLENGTTLRQAAAFHLASQSPTCSTSRTWPAGTVSSVPGRC